MKKIKINFVDFWQGFDKENNNISNLLKKYYAVEISESPDYIFFSCFGFEFTKYDCIRIFVTGENIRPDFNICDYAMGFDYLEFEDRYIRFPFLWFYYKRSGFFDEAVNTHIINADILNSKKRFCNFIYSNGITETGRDNFFGLLSQYKHVDSLGKHLNNVNESIGNSVEDKINIQKKYKFTIAFENSSMRGYNTEKILHAFAAQTIPIYYGDEMIDKLYNESAFVNCHKYNDWEAVIDRVRELDNDEELYMSMLKAPINIVGRIPGISQAESFLTHIFNQDLKQAFRRDNYIWSKRVEELYQNGNKKGKCNILSRLLARF